MKLSSTHTVLQREAVCKVKTKTKSVQVFLLLLLFSMLTKMKHEIVVKKDKVVFKNSKQ